MSKCLFLWYVPSISPSHTGISIACYLTSARTAGRNGTLIIIPTLLQGCHLHPYRRKDTRNLYSRTWIEHSLFSVALMPQTRTPEAGVFQARLKQKPPGPEKVLHCRQWGRSVGSVLCATEYSGTSSRFFSGTPMSAAATRSRVPDRGRISHQGPASWDNHTTGIFWGRGTRVPNSC